MVPTICILINATTTPLKVLLRLHLQYLHFLLIQLQVLVLLVVTLLHSPPLLRLTLQLTLRRMVYLTIKEMAKIANDVIIVTSRYVCYLLFNDLNILMMCNATAHLVFEFLVIPSVDCKHNMKSIPCIYYLLLMLLW